MDKIGLYKYHSYAACIGEGYKFLAKHLWLCVKVMMPWYVVTSLFTILSLAITVKINVAVMAEMPCEMYELGIDIAFFVMAWLTYMLGTGRMFLMFRRLAGREQLQDDAVMAAEEGTQTKKESAWKLTQRRTVQLAWKGAPYLACLMALNVAYAFLSDYYLQLLESVELSYKVLIVIVTLFVFLAALVSVVPLFYCYYCRMMQYNENIPFVVAYKKGFSHKGKIFGVLMLSAFLLLLQSVLLLLPGFVSTQAYFGSIEGTVNFGDEILIPVSGYVFMLIASTVALSFAHLLAMSFHATMLYLYGDVHSSSQYSTISKS